MLTEEQEQKLLGELRITFSRSLKLGLGNLARISSLDVKQDIIKILGLNGDEAETIKDAKKWIEDSTQIIVTESEKILLENLAKY